MNNRKFIVYSIIILTMVSIIAGCYAIVTYKNNDKTPAKVSDGELKFKKEYEYLNNKEEDGHIHNKISVSKNNGIVYISDTDLVERMKHKSGVVFIGNNNDELSRLVIEPLLTSKENTGLKHIYYLDITGIQSELALTKKNKIKTIRKGTDSYYELLSILDYYLNPYLLYNDDKEIDTKEKRINIPLVVAFDKGNIIGIHEGSVSTHMLLNDPYTKLSESEVNELVNTYTNIMNKYLESK